MTNINANGPVLVSTSPEGIVRSSDGYLELDTSPQLSCRYDQAQAVLWTRSTPRGIPCFSLDLLREMERASLNIEGYFADHEGTRPLGHIVVCSGVPGVFNAGGDLSYFLRLITSQDRARLTEYARTAVSVAYRNYTGHGLKGVTTVALLEGDALGGGFESALSCDIVIAEEHVKAGFPEVLFNMFPGMGGLSFLGRRVARRMSDEIARSGRLYSARELFEMGVIDQVVPTGQGAAAVARLLRKRESQQDAQVAMNVVDRMLRPVTLDELTDVVRMWVDCALALTPRNLEWMRRLHRQQVATFGRHLSVVPAPTLARAAAA